MAELIQSLDSYHDFERSSYFIICFDRIASRLLFETPLEESKENMQAVLETIVLHSQELEVVFKHWNTKIPKTQAYLKTFPTNIF